MSKTIKIIIPIHVRAVLERTETGWSASAPGIPGCVATGRTRRECENEMTDAIYFHLKGLLADASGGK